jgi:hypothetical protein
MNRIYFEFFSFRHFFFKQTYNPNNFSIREKFLINSAQDEKSFALKKKIKRRRDRKRSLK